MTRRQAEKIGKQALHPKAFDLTVRPLAPRREERAARLLARRFRRYGGDRRKIGVRRLGRRALRWLLVLGAYRAPLGRYGDSMFATFLLNGWTLPHRSRS